MKRLEFIFLQRLSKDLKYIINEMGPGQYFGALTMLFNQTHSGTVRAKTYCEIFTLKNTDLEQVLVNYPTVNKYVATICSLVSLPSLVSVSLSN